MSRPLCGKGDRVSGGRGELALNPRLPHNQRICPNTPRKQNRTKRARPYNTASEFPLSDTLTGATSPQRARLIL